MLQTENTLKYLIVGVAVLLPVSVLLPQWTGSDDVTEGVMLSI